MAREVERKRSLTLLEKPSQRLFHVRLIFLQSTCSVPQNLPYDSPFYGDK